MKRTLILASLSMLTTLFGCKKHNNIVPRGNNRIGNSVMLSDSTIVLSHSILESSLVSIDSSRIVFSPGNDTLNKIHSGSILVGGISIAAPNGFLRKITSVSNSNGEIICNTQQASLTDAIVNADIEVTRNISDSNIMQIDSSGIDITARKRSGTSFKRISLSAGITFDTAIYDGDGNYKTTNDQIRIIGSVQGTPSLSFILKIRHRQVQQFEIEYNQSLTEKLAAYCNVKLLSFDINQLLYTIQLYPVEIWFGPIPIVFTQSLPIVAGIKGSVDEYITAGVQNSTTLDEGINYENGNWATINSATNNFKLDPLTFGISASVEPYLELRYEFRLYGDKDARIYLAGKAGLDATANIANTGLTLGAAWDIELSGGAKMSVLGAQLADYDQTFWQQTYPIQISNPNVFAFPTLTTNAASDITKTSAQCGGVITSNGGAKVTASGVCWSTTPNPTIQDKTIISSVEKSTFTLSLTNLTPGDTYYARAFANNSAGTGYGNQITFTTKGGSQSPGPTTTDTIWIKSGNDTYYGTVYVTSGGANQPKLYIGGWGDYYFDFLQFDVSGGPSASQTDSAELWLYGSAPNDPQLQVKRIFNSWTNVSVSASNYPQCSNTLAVMDPVPSTPGWFKVDITELYKGWKNGSFPNYGLELAPTYNDQTNGSVASSENANVNLRPHLVIYEK